MRAILQCNQWIWFDNITNSEEDILWEEFSVSKPNAYIDPSQMSMWDGVYRKYNRAKQRMARPLLSMLRGVCQKHNLPLEILDKREPWKYSALNPEAIDKDFLPGIVMDDHQLRAIQRACKIECGIIDVPTGGGKGEIISGFCKAIDCPTVIVADQRVVIDQLKARLELRDIDTDIGMFYGGKRPSGQTIVVGSIQSLQPPSKIPDLPIKKSGESDEEFAKRSKKWDAMYQAYKTRQKNAKYLQGYVRRAEMLIVDECDRAISEPFKKLFRHWFKGRRRYGFCLSGETIIETVHGPRRLCDFHDGDEVILLSQNGSFQHGTILYTGEKQTYRIELENGLVLCCSEDHLLADNTGNYIRAGDITPGHLVQIENDTLVNKLKDLSNALSKVDPSFDLSKISWAGFELSRSNLEKEFVCTKINNIFSGTIEFVIDSRLLCLEDDVVSVHELHEQEFIGRGEVKQVTSTCKKISCSELSLEFQSAATISFRECFADLLPDSGVINRISTEFAKHSFNSVVDSGCHLEANGHTVSLYHCSLNHIDDFVGLHRMINTILSEAGLSPFRLIVERLTSVPLFFDGVCSFLMFWDGKPILHAVLVDHFLFVGFDSLLPSLNNMREILNTLRAQMPSKFFDLIIWAIDRAFKNATTIITSYSDDILIPWFTVIPFSFDDSHALSLLKGAPFYLCQKDAPVMSVSKMDYKEPMYDVVNVSKTANFIANSILVHNSGTPFDSDKPVEGMVMQEHLGSVIAKETRKNLVAIGRIIQCDYNMMAIGPFDGIKNSDAYDIAREEHMVQSESFHRLIAGLCKKYKGDGTLVLVEREPLGHALVEAINKMGLTAHFIYGKTPKRRRDELLRSFERREFDVLIGGKIINRGLDLAGGCENLIIATGGKLQSEFEQKIGRALRRNRRGKSRVFDFFFRCNKYLYNHSKARLKVMVGLDYETKVIFPGGSIDGAKLIERRFQVPRGYFEPAAQKRLFAE